MKKLFLAIFFTFLSLAQIYSFTITVQKDPNLQSPVVIKVEVDGIPRTIGDFNFQNLGLNGFETTLMNPATLTITAKSDALEVKFESKITGARIFSISKIGDKLEIK
ncbi:hypothetical protein KJ644_00215 [Candidatus Dependentiae bacterium]|nr:hypothetical protein [Candidatus Dependentiae bacterium]MBU4386883.1 hypothetical protein [Candidatus Dependentiae bacterium]MCG2755970.1 hypothetical protein [Candidatus Dependentiae bacterium]